MKNKSHTCAIIALSICLITTNCSREKHNGSKKIPHLVIRDIQEGIEKYIDDQSKLGGGYFKFKSGEKEFLFKLVRVHTEYLSNLGPRSNFACVDLVDTSGDVYDVDFFLFGDPGNMKVTESSLHKINGKPYYTWKQGWFGRWKRVPVNEATNDLLGIITDQDEFEFNYLVELPEIKGKARMWIPEAETDDYQTVSIKEINSPVKYSELEEKKYGNKIFFFELSHEDSKKSIEIIYRVKRFEKSAYVSKNEDASKYLNADRLVPDGVNFRKIAQTAVKDKNGDLVRARALYDHVIERMDYIKYGEGWGNGDALYACDMRKGNCTDFHAYFIALARSIGIPARFAIGAAIPSSRNDGGIDGYHCWVEFYAEGKWRPVDISEADKYSSLATYYFGHHPANRFELSRGRDLIVIPGPLSGPINFHAYPVFEIEGKAVKVKPIFSFTRI